MRSISEMARASGLTVSALRFYDRAGVLVPAFVDPETGYRWYAQEQIQPARLVAGLRRVGMPLAEIAVVLARRSDAGMAGQLLDAHLRRLEDGLADARRELSRVRALLANEENPMTAPAATTHLMLAGTDFAAALDAVRFAVGSDPGMPVLGGVLLEAQEAALRLVATDRYRLAISEAPALDVTGPQASALVPVGVLDDVRSLLPDAGQVAVTIGAAAITVEAHGRRVSGQCLDLEFPDYRRLLHDTRAHRVTVGVADLQQALAAASTRTVVREQDGARCDVVVLHLDGAGQLTIAPAGPAEAGEGLQVGVNREFLLDALTAPGRDQLVLELDGPVTPLAVRVPGDARTFSILMPTKLA
jgi:DNA polymerase III sliding clamp (beta) subunit (PCNA family)